MQRRSNARVSVNYEVDLIVNGFVHARCPTRNLALGGVYLELEHVIPPPPGTEIDLIFNPIEDTHGRFSATVTRVDTEGIACKFENVGQSELERLRSLLNTRQ